MLRFFECLLLNPNIQRCKIKKKESYKFQRLLVKGKLQSSDNQSIQTISAKSQILSRVSQRNSPAITPSTGLSTRYVTRYIRPSIPIFPPHFFPLPVLARVVGRQGLAAYRAISRVPRQFQASRNG